MAFTGGAVFLTFARQRDAGSRYKSLSLDRVVRSFLLLRARSRVTRLRQRSGPLRSPMPDFTRILIEPISGQGSTDAPSARRIKSAPAARPAKAHRNFLCGLSRPSSVERIAGNVLKTENGQGARLTFSRFSLKTRTRGQTSQRQVSSFSALLFSRNFNCYIDTFLHYLSETSSDLSGKKRARASCSCVCERVLQIK